MTSDCRSDGLPGAIARIEADVQRGAGERCPPTSDDASWAMRQFGDCTAGQQQPEHALQGD